MSATCAGWGKFIETDLKRRNYSGHVHGRLRKNQEPICGRPRPFTPVCLSAPLLQSFLKPFLSFFVLCSFIAFIARYGQTEWQSSSGGHFLNSHRYTFCGQWEKGGGREKWSRSSKWKSFESNCRISTSFWTTTVQPVLASLLVNHSRASQGRKSPRSRGKSGFTFTFALSHSISFAHQNRGGPKTKDRADIWTRPLLFPWQAFM